MQLAPSPLSLSLSLGQLPLAQLINDRMMHFQIARPSIAIWPARIRLALSLISVSLRHIVLLSLVFSPFHKAFPSSDVYREGRVVEHQNVPDLKWSTSIHLSYSMVRIRLAGSSQLYELCIKRNQKKKTFSIWPVLKLVAFEVVGKQICCRALVCNSGRPERQTKIDPCSSSAHIQ